MFGGAFLDAAAHDLGDRHAGDAQIVEGALELVELGSFAMMDTLCIPVS